VSWRRAIASTTSTGRQPLHVERKTMRMTQNRIPGICCRDTRKEQRVDACRPDAHEIHDEPAANAVNRYSTGARTSSPVNTLPMRCASAYRNDDFDQGCTRFYCLIGRGACRVVHDRRTKSLVGPRGRIGRDGGLPWQCRRFVGVDDLVETQILPSLPPFAI
jgi:hypothetical protein